MKKLEQDLIKILSNSFIASTKKLGLLLNQKIDVVLENVNIIEDIDSVSDILENLVIIQNFCSLGEIYTVLPVSCASPLAEIIMSGEVTGGEEVGELKENALKESFSQIIDVYSEKMSKDLFQSFAFDIKKVLYAKDFKATKALMPSVLQGAMIIDYKFSSALIPKEVIRQIVPIELFNQLLELLKPDIETTEDFTNMQDPSNDDSIMVQPVQFPSFADQTSIQLEGNKNFNLLLDIKLKLTVELGRAELPIKRVLELTRGSIIELDKIAGEPVELYANNKLVARGEVVVIEDNFGLRITNIISPDDRIKNL
jgi:flagellar motor switch protein FliN/FliY